MGEWEGDGGVVLWEVEVELFCFLFLDIYGEFDLEAGGGAGSHLSWGVVV